MALFGRSATKGRDSDRLRARAARRSPEGPSGLSSAFNSSFDIVAVLDGDDGPRQVQQADLDAMGIGPGEALELAVSQTVHQVLVGLRPQPHRLPTGESAVLAAADGVPYVSAGITSISQLAGRDLPYGALVAVPAHSAILILPVATRATLGNVGILAGFAASMHDDAADPCTPGLYWFVDGDAHPIGTEPGDDGSQRLVLAAPLQGAIERLPT